MLTLVNMNATRESILGAACDIYLLEGYKGMSMRKVAMRIGLSPTAIYRHFKNKEELHHEVLRTGFRTFDSYLKKAQGEKSPMERLRLAADQFFRFATEQRKYYEILFLTMDHTVEHRVKGALNNDAFASQQFMEDRVRECMEDGSLKNDSPGEVAMLLLATCNGFFALYVSKKRKDTQKEMRAKYQRMFDRLLGGLQ
jgi:AcrR family transcriptional regulator